MTRYAVYNEDKLLLARFRYRVDAMLFVNTISNDYSLEIVEELVE